MASFFLSLSLSFREENSDSFSEIVCFRFLHKFLDSCLGSPFFLFLGSQTLMLG